MRRAFGTNIIRSITRNPARDVQNILRSPMTARRTDGRDFLLDAYTFVYSSASYYCNVLYGFGKTVVAYSWFPIVIENSHLFHIRRKQKTKLRTFSELKYLDFFRVFSKEFVSCADFSRLLEFNTSFSSVDLSQTKKSIASVKYLL